MNLEVKIKTIDSSKVKAFADVTFDKCFVVTGFKIIDSAKGLFVSMPSQKMKNKEGVEEYKDTSFPITKEFRSKLNAAILDKYSGSNKQVEHDDLPF